MIKSEFAEKVAEKVEMSKAQAAVVTDAVLDTIVEALKVGEEIRFLGFGTFKVDTIPARKARNPRTGETLNLPERKKVKFKAGKELKM